MRSAKVMRVYIAVCDDACPWTSSFCDTKAAAQEEADCHNAEYHDDAERQAFA